MFNREHDAARVGFWALVVAVVTGLVVLLVHGVAESAERLSTAELAEVFAERTPVSAAENLEAAREILAQDRNRRAFRLGATLLDGGFRLWSGATPSRVASAAARMARGVAGLRAGAEARNQAMQLLEAAVVSGTEDAQLEALYQKMRARERGELLGQRLDAAERALARGDFLLARVLIERALEAEPTSVRAAALDEQLRALNRVTLELPPPAQSVMEGWEAPLALALLTENYDRAATFEADDRDAALARAVARYLNGGAGEALLTFESLADWPDAAGSLAQDWVASPRLNVAMALEHAERRYRNELWLGRLGGEELSSAGLPLSVSGVKRWSHALQPTNLLLGAPVRTWRGWSGDDSELREASVRYLDTLPEGAKSDAAASRLRDLDAARSRRDAAWDDARFRLPPARTAFVGLTPLPVLLSRAVVLSEEVGDVTVASRILGSAPVLRMSTQPEAGEALPAKEALDLLTDLARAVENDSLRAHQTTRSQVLDALHRLDRVVRNGAVLFVEAWAEEGGEGAQILDGLASARQARYGDIDLQSGRDELQGERAFGRAAFACPAGSACIDRDRLLNGAVYSTLELDSDFHIGARTGFNRASIAFEIGRSGPEAKLVLPIGEWLHIDDWMPVDARFSIGVDGLGFRPDFDRD